MGYYCRCVCNRDSCGDGIQWTASLVLAGGFQIFEVGVKGQGVAHAGMASRADSPGTINSILPAWFTFPPAR